MDSFKNGFEFAAKQFAGAFGGMSAGVYVDLVDIEVQKMMNKLYEEAARRNGVDTEHLQGFVAEVWHTYTQRMNAAVKGKSVDTNMPESVTLGSVDVLSGGKAYSSKYYSTAGNTVRAQATTIEGHYNLLKKAAEKRGEEYMSLDEYMAKYFPNAKSPSQSIYYTQGRLVPADQIEEAKEILRKKILKETANGRMDVVENLQDVLDSLTDTIDDGNGNKSIQLTREQASLLAKASKNGELDEVFEKLGITLKDLIKPEDIMREAFKAGLSAAILSFVINVTPVVLNALSYLIQTGKVDARKLKEGGLEVLDQTAKSFVLGTISAGLTIAAKSGHLGVAFQSVNPTIIGVVVALTFTCIESSYKLATKKINKQEFAQEMMRNCFVSVCSLASGIALQALLYKIPVVAYLVGSVVGSVIGSLAYTVTEKVMLAYCVESGCSFFGLIDQNYELDKEILEDMGIDLLEVECFGSEQFEYDAFVAETIDYESFQYEHFGVKILKRGIIEVFSIGYI